MSGSKLSGTDTPLFYSLIIKQLRDDGHIEAANIIANTTKIQELKSIGLPSLAQIIRLHIIMASDVPQDIGEDIPVTIAPYRVEYITKHKGIIKSARYSSDGRFVATASGDTTSKILDVSRFSNRGPKPIDDDEFKLSRPVMKTYADHTQPVTDVDFHPFQPLLASCSKDCTIRFFDTTKSKKAHKKIDDVYSIRSLNFHPTGDFLLVGADDTKLRLYDVNTLSGFLIPETHRDSINSVRWSKNANMYASTSKDGDIRIYDGVTNECIRLLSDAHGGLSVAHAEFTKDGNKLVSVGQDQIIRMWDVGTGEKIQQYEGFFSNYRANIAISHCGNFIYGPDGKGNVIHIWDIVSAKIVSSLSGHAAPVRYISASPSEQSFVTCGDDLQAKFWTSEVKQVN